MRIAEALRAKPDEVTRARALAEKLAELNRHNRKRTARTERPRPARPPSGLPRPDQHFTGRVRELKDLVEAIGARDRLPLCVVSGMAGAGKTALVVRAAAEVAAAFPDGVLFLDLHGYTAGHPALTAGDALDRLLRRLNVPGDQIPAQLDERAALYADRLSQRQLLLILDNARDAAQVRLLLPGTPGVAVLVTSRTPLTALDDAHPLVLDVLEPDEAAQLFRSVAGAQRLAGQRDAEQAVASIVARCARLPLAVRIVAARYRTAAAMTLADLDARLSNANASLAEMQDDERSVTASFQLSFTGLPPDLARTFALLAVHPGADIDTVAAAALLGLPPAEATGHLDLLVHRGLLLAHARGRYRLHDLVAAFARHHALPALPDTQPPQALRRLLDCYLRAAEQADRLITPHRYRVPLDLSERTAVLPDLPDHDAARRWLDLEQANLVDACLAAGAAGLDTSCWQLAYTLRGYFFLSKQWQPWIASHEAGTAAARRLGDVRAQAMMTNNLGMAHLERGQHDVAAGTTAARYACSPAAGTATARSPHAPTSPGSPTRLGGTPSSSGTWGRSWRSTGTTAPRATPRSPNAAWGWPAPRWATPTRRSPTCRRPWRRSSGSACSWTPP